MATISTHNGGGKAHRDHNIRNEKVIEREKDPDHIDPNGEFEIWKDEEPRQAYERIFGDSVKAYNEKQTRTDRQIDNYFDKVSKDPKQHNVYEMIVGIYAKQGEALPDELNKNMLKEFTEGWKDRNPNLELIGAYFHNDEAGGMHVHLDYIPVAHGYKNGMETRTGLSQALREQGFGGEKETSKNTPVIQWERRENQALENICKAHGIEVEHPKLENVQHLETETYKAQKSLDSSIDHVKDLDKHISKLEDDLKRLEGDIERGLKIKQQAFDKSWKKSKDNQGFTYDRNLKSDIDKTVKDMKGWSEDLEKTRDYDAKREQERSEKLCHDMRQQARDEAKSMKDEAQVFYDKGKEYEHNQESFILGTAENKAQAKFDAFKEQLIGDKEEFMDFFKEKFGNLTMNGKPFTEVIEKAFSKYLEDLEEEWDRGLGF